MTRCAHPGCGFEVSERKVQNWKSRRKRKPGLNGPYCSADCANDHRDIKARKALRDYQNFALRRGAS